MPTLDVQIRDCSGGLNPAACAYASGGLNPAATIQFKTAMSLLIFLLLASLPARPQASETLCLLTYNIRLDTPADGVNQWGNRKEKVAALLKKSEPDVFGVQEALHNQMLDLQALLPEYSNYGAGRDDGKTAGEFSAIFFKKEKFDLLQSGTFWLSETPEKPGSKSWDAAITRVCSWVELKAKRSGKTFFVFNTHFDHQGETARLNSAKLLQKRAIEIARTMPFIVMGDFNFEPSAQPYQVMQDQKLWKLQDAWLVGHRAKALKNCTFTGFEVGGETCRRIDYIFASEHFQVKSASIISEHDGKFYPSDHLPVMAALRF